MKIVTTFIFIILIITSNLANAVVLNTTRSKIEQSLMDLKLGMDSSAPIVLNSETKKLFIPDGTMYEVIYVCKHQEKKKSETCYFAKIGIK